MSKAKHARHAASKAVDAFEVADGDAAVDSEELAGDSAALGSAEFAASADMADMADASASFAAASPAAFGVAEPAKPIDMGKATRTHTPWKVFGIVMAVICGVLALVYVAGAVVFMGRFFPNTVMRDMDVSLKTPDEVNRVMQDSAAGYRLRLEGEGFSLDLSAADAGLALDGKALAENVLSEMNPWAWPYEVFQYHDETEALVASFNESGLANVVGAAVESFNASATSPENAYIAFDEQKGQFVIVPEKKGTALSAEAVTQLAARSLVAFEPKAKVTGEQLALPAVLSSDPLLTQATATANGMILVNVSFTMAGTRAVTLDASVVSKWVVIGDDLSVTLDEDALAAWVDEVASTYTTTGTERAYTRPDGKQITVSGGSYGWQVDHDALLEQVKSAVDSDQTGEVEMPCTHTSGAFSTVGAQDWGPRYVDVDLSEQYARMYDGSSELIWESAIVSGKPGRGGSGSITPTGVYYITTKASPSVLRGRNDDGSEYESHVTYWMPFVGNAVGLHDASWQSSFGGTRYRDGAGSHGCVNLPTSKARDLYGIIELADVVVVHW